MRTMSPAVCVLSLCLISLPAAAEDALRRQAVDTALRLGLPLENDVIDVLQDTILYARAENRGGGVGRIDDNPRYLEYALVRIPKERLAGRFALENGGQRNSSTAAKGRIAPLTTYTGVAVTSFTSSGPAAGGNNVSITGLNFKPGVSVSFGGVASPSVNFFSCTFISAVAPAGTGAVSITVTNPDGPSVTPMSNYTYTAAAAGTLTVRGMSPAAGPALGGTAITITGSGFGATATVTFTFVGGGSGSATSVIVQNPTTITAVTPLGSPGPAGVVVSSSGQTATLAGSYFFNPPAPPPPTITSLSATSGAQGSTLTINGTNFTSPMTVVFRTPQWTAGGNFIATQTVIPTSSTQLNAVIPSRAMTGPIVVFNAFGAASTCGIFTVTAAGPPAISSFTPPSGGVGTPNQSATTVSITGTNFVNVTQVMLNGRPQNFSISDATTILMSPTPSASSGVIEVRTHAGNAVSASSYTVTPMTYCEGTPPTISGIASSTIAPAGSTTINGFNFSSTVFAYLTDDPFPSLTNGSIGTSVTLYGDPGSTDGPAYVVTDYGTAVGPPVSVSSTPTPTITSMSRSSSNRGDFITLTGTNLNNFVQARFGGLVYPVFEIPFNPTTFSFGVPNGAATGAIYMDGPAGTAVSPNVTISCDAPVLSSFSPPQAATNKTVSLTGQNLIGTSFDGSLIAFFGGVRANGTSSVNGTTANAAVPPGAPKGPITVQTLYGSATSATNFNPLGSTKGDFDLDFRSDVIFRSQVSGNVVQWMMNGAFLTKVNVLGGVDPTYRIEGTGDFDGNGRADLLWRAPSSGNVVMWLMSGSTIMRSVLIGSVSTAYHIEGVGDLDADGKSDVVWRNSTTGDVVLWLMIGATVVQVTDLGPVDPSAHIEAVEDMNADGWADFVWRNVSTGAVTVWLTKGDVLHGAAGPYVTSASPGSISTAYHIEAGADFNGDGKGDLIFRNAASGDTIMWLMNGTAIVSNVAMGGVASDFLIEAASDLDADGKADLMWRGQTSGNVIVWLMNGSTIRSVTVVGSVDTNYHIESPTPR